jgi:hypothetical protein
MKKRTLTTICISLFALGHMFAQSSIDFHAGLANPLKDFYSFDSGNPKTMGAAPGVTVGFLFNQQLSEKGFGLFLGTDLMINWLRKPAKDFVVESAPAGYLENDFKHQKYFNVPVSVGFSYTYKAEENFALFANAGMVVNYLKVTDFELKTYKKEYESGLSLGYKVGGGLIINERTSIAANYFVTGEHYIKSTENMGQQATFHGKYLLRTTVMTLTLGRHF